MRPPNRSKRFATQQRAVKDLGAKDASRGKPLKDHAPQVVQEQHAIALGVVRHDLFQGRDAAGCVCEGRCVPGEQA
jgi:hypothetical protein